MAKKPRKPRFYVRATMMRKSSMEPLGEKILVVEPELAWVSLCGIAIRGCLANPTMPYEHESDVFFIVNLIKA